MDGVIHVPAGSRAGPTAELIAWLWRLGPLLDDPAPCAVGIGAVEEAEGLEALVRERRLAGAIVLAPEPGPASGCVPARREVEGLARFGPGEAVAGRFVVFGMGRGVTVSSCGAHAVELRDRMLAVGCDPALEWGTLTCYWAFSTLASFLIEVLDRPLVALPAIGLLRLDDVPGTAQHQLEGRAHRDPRQRRRVVRLRRAFRRAEAVLNVAVCSRALASGEIVPLDEVWPSSVQALAEGVREGVFEPVCHGWLHADPVQARVGHVEFREFAQLGQAEAGRRIDETMAWQEARLGKRPTMFVAPAWGYSAGTLEAARERGLVTFLPPEPGPLLADGWLLRETLHSSLGGQRGLSLRPFARLAAAGVPPTVVFHGALFDPRLAELTYPRDLITILRLALKKDLFRIAGLQDLAWVPGPALVDALRAHCEVEVQGTRVRPGMGWSGRVLGRGDARLRPYPARGRSFGRGRR